MKKSHVQYVVVRGSHSHAYGKKALLVKNRHYAMYIIFSSLLSLRENVAQHVAQQHMYIPVRSIDTNTPAIIMA